MSVQSEVAAGLGGWDQLIAAVVGNNPRADIYDLLGRPDVASLLREELAADRALVEVALLTAWPIPPPSLYRDRLEGDIATAYDQAEAVMRGAAVQAFYSITAGEFIPGVSVPGSNPVMEAARARQRAVAQAVAAAALWLGFRNEMTIEVARVRHRAELVLAEGAGSGWLKKWECRKDAAGRPDHRVCDWCRRLDALPAIPLWQEFSYGGYMGRRRPPNVYYDLQCPPRHPRCRCRIILLRAGAPPSPQQPAAAAAPVLFIPAESVRTMPEDRYQALRDFHRAALHELGQVLRKHSEVGLGEQQVPAARGRHPAGGVDRQATGPGG